MGAHALHLAASELVCAAGAGGGAAAHRTLLSDQERAVYHRGRNAHSGTVPRHASVADYRVATGLEALVGYLYLTGADRGGSVRSCARRLRRRMARSNRRQRNGRYGMARNTYGPPAARGGAAAAG